jgi:hypothetical protein
LPSPDCPRPAGLSHTIPISPESFTATTEV